MQDYLIVLALAALPAAGNFAGGLLAEVLPLSRRILSLALHTAAGIILAVVGIELMEQVLQATPPWVPVLALIAGGGFAVVLDKLVGLVSARLGGAEGDTAPWLIFIGVSIDLVSDGILIGTGSTIAIGLGLLLALGQVPADLPEGFATIVSFREQGVSRRKRMWLAASFTLPIFLGATIGYWAVRGQPELYKLVLLAFTAGILLTVAVEEMISEAHRRAEESSWDTLALVGGFALFALLSVYLEGA